MTDRLTLTRALEGSGMQSAAAERIATEIYHAIHDNVATKADVEHAVTTLRGEMVMRFAAVETKFEALEHHITRMTNRLVVVVIAVAGLLGTALHYWR